MALEQDAAGPRWPRRARLTQAPAETRMRVAVAVTAAHRFRHRRPQAVTVLSGWEQPAAFLTRIDPSRL